MEWILRVCIFCFFALLWYASWIHVPFDLWERHNINVLLLIQRQQVCWGWFWESSFVLAIGWRACGFLAGISLNFVRLRELWTETSEQRRSISQQTSKCFISRTEMLSAIVSVPDWQNGLELSISSSSAVCLSYPTQSVVFVMSKHAIKSLLKSWDGRFRTF